MYLAKLGTYSINGINMVGSSKKTWRTWGCLTWFKNRNRAVILNEWCLITFWKTTKIWPASLGFWCWMITSIWVIDFRNNHEPTGVLETVQIPRGQVYQQKRGWRKKHHDLAMTELILGIQCCHESPCRTCKRPEKKTWTRERWFIILWWPI